MRPVDGREASTVCEVCRKPSVFHPFGKAPAMRMDTNYHRAASSDDVAWDHILGESADMGRRKINDEFREKNKIIAEGGAAVFRQDKGTYRPAMVGDVPQMVANAAAAKSPVVREEIRTGKVKNDLVPPK
jgi:hypothetical protein